MILPLGGTTCNLRAWKQGDAASLALHANDEGVARNLRDAFPHPYALEDAEQYLSAVVNVTQPNMLAIEVDEQAVGGIGIKRLEDVERVGAEIGYWLGREYWGRGIVTEALGMATGYFMQSFELSRIFALPFARNSASLRVLEKAGYKREGVLHRSAIKNGVLQDQMLYAYVPLGSANS